jgi:folate-dependent phosphoribosylglycinamide formyltransferase PurN
MIWIAFFSQTGSEIVELSKSLGRKPDLIVTNNFEEKIKYHSGVKELGVTLMSAKHDLLMNYFRDQSVYYTDQTIISLHGYLRILPPDICEQYEIYNGHPGAITIFPELKGKNPQEKVWLENEKYNIIGSVVHRCTAELDAGDIVKSVMVRNRCYSRDEVYASLKMTSLSAWDFFMKEKGLCV